MRSKIMFPLLVVSIAAVTSFAHAQGHRTEPQTGAPGVITGGSGEVSVGGQPAARQGDATDQGSPAVQGSSNVMINGRPAVTLGDRTGCGGLVVGGASNVFINGKPVARAGDLTTGCESK